MANSESGDYLIEVLAEEELVSACPAHWSWGFAVEVRKLVQLMRRCAVPCGLRWLVRKAFGHPEVAVFFVPEEKTYPVANCISDAIANNSRFISRASCIPGMIFLFFEPNPRNPDASHDSDHSMEIDPEPHSGEDTSRLRAAMLDCLKAP